MLRHAALRSTGHFVAPEPDAIATSVLKLMANGVELDVKSRANAERAKEHYSWTRVCNDYERALRRLLRA